MHGQQNKKKMLLLVSQYQTPSIFLDLQGIYSVYGRKPLHNIRIRSNVDHEKCYIFVWY